LPDFTVDITGVTYYPQDPWSPPGEDLWRLFFSAGTYVVPVVGGRVPIQVELSHSNTTGPLLPTGALARNRPGTPMDIPFTVSGTGVRGTDWNLYPTETSTSVFEGEHFTIRNGERTGVLWIEALATSGTVVLTLATSSATATLDPLVIIDTSGHPVVATITLVEQGSGTPDWRFTGFVSTTDENQPPQEPHKVQFRPDLTVPVAGCSFDITLTGTATTPADYRAIWRRLPGEQFGSLGAGANPITMVQGDTGLDIEITTIPDYTTEPGPRETVIVTADNPTGCTIDGANATDDHTVSIVDTSRDGVSVYFHPERFTLVSEPPGESAQYTVAHVVLDDVDPVNSITVRCELVFDGSAEPADISIASGEYITFQPGEGLLDPPEPYQAVVVEVTGNDGTEIDETVTLRIAEISEVNPGPHPGHAILAGEDSFEITIVNLDTNPEIEWQFPTSAYEQIGVVQQRVQLSHVSNVDQTVEVLEWISGSLGGVEIIDPPASPNHILTIPAGSLTGTVTFQIHVLPTSPEDWTFRITNPVGGGTIGAQRDHVMTVSPAPVQTPLIRFDGPDSVNLVEDWEASGDPLHLIEVDQANSVPLDGDVIVTIEATTGIGGTDPATRGVDWDLCNQNGVVIAPTSTSPLDRWELTVPVSLGLGRLNVFYKLYKDAESENLENFKLTLVGVVSTVGQDVALSSLPGEREHEVNIINFATDEEQLHGLAPPRQGIPGGTTASGQPNRPDIIILRDSDTSGRVQITNVNVVPLPPGDPFGDALNAAGWTDTGNGFTIPYNVGSGQAGPGVCVAMRCAMFVWYAKNYGQFSGYVNPLTGVAQTPAQPDHIWLQQFENLPTDGNFPVVIWLSPNGNHPDPAKRVKFHEDLTTDYGKRIAFLDNSGGDRYHVYWDISVGCPIVRDIIFIGDGNVEGGAIPDTTVPGMDCQGEGRPWGWLAPQPLPVQNPVAHTASFDNLRFQGVSLRVARVPNASSPHGPGNGTQTLNFSHKGLGQVAPPGGSLKLYDCYIGGSDEEYHEGTRHKWGCHNSPSMMHDWRNVGVASANEHCCYGKYLGPHSYFIDVWQHYYGNGYNGNSCQFMRAVDRGNALCQDERSARDTGGLPNSILLYLRCHARNNGYNLVGQRTIPGEANYRPESWNGTVYLRDCMNTGRMGDVGEESSITAFKIGAIGIYDDNSSKRYDYGEADGATTGPVTITWQNWPLGHPQPPAGGVTHTFAATSELAGGTGCRAYPRVPPNTYPPGDCGFAAVCNGSDDWNPNEAHGTFFDTPSGSWPTRKLILHNFSVRTDGGPGGGSNQALLQLNTCREIEIIVDESITATVYDGGLDWQGGPSPTPNAVPVTGLLRPSSGAPFQTRELIRTNNWQDPSHSSDCPGQHNYEEANGLIKWGGTLATNRTDADWWDPTAVGAWLRHGLTEGETTPADSFHTDPAGNVYGGHEPPGSPVSLTDDQIDRYDGSNPA
jgi:hypothetical protein